MSLIASQLEDINQDLDQLYSGKAPGKDGIPAEVKCAKGTLLKELHEILCKYWRKDEAPQDKKDANIGTRSRVTVPINVPSPSSISLANSLPKLS